MRAWRHTKICSKTFEDVVRVREENDRHRAGSSKQPRRQSSAAVAAQEDGVFNGVTVIDEDVVVGTFGVHLGEGEGDVVGLVVG